MNETEIREAVDNDKISFSDLYNELQIKDLGNWDDVNSKEVILNYCRDKMFDDVHVSHILSVLESNPSCEDLYQIWLGNSCETPSPIMNKLDLVKALELITKKKFTLTVRESKSIDVEIEAEDILNAIDEVETKYKDGEYDIMMNSGEYDDIEVFEK